MFPTFFLNRIIAYNDPTERIFIMLTWLYKMLFYLPVKILVKSSSIPSDPTVELNVDPGKPILYIFKTDSIIDFLALHFLSKKIALPSPFKPLILNNTPITRYIFLYKSPFLFSTHAKKRLKGYQIFKQWIDFHHEHPNCDFQIIIVPSFWNRNPGLRKSNQQPSNLTISSTLKNIYHMIMHGRDHTFLLSSLLTLNGLLGHRSVIKGKTDDHALLFERLTRMYFFRCEKISKGPNLPERRQLIEELLRQINVKNAILAETEASGQSERHITRKARKIIDEMIANLSFGVIHFANGIARYFWNHLYKGINVTGDETVRSLVQNGHEIIYIPTHRSHMDYLLLAYVIYNAGLTPPHVASGINLNFWPFGMFIRRCGAFFLRRSFNGDKLYTCIFREYVSYLCSHGFSLEFFIEGKRSRTGRLLNPKTGMLSMMVQTMLRGTSRPVSIVPVYLSYEHIMEVHSYTKELLGIKKETENIWQIFGIFKKLRNYGHGYVNFGEPISIYKFLNNYQKDWHDSIDPSGNFKPKWLYSCVSDLAHQIMFNLSQAAAVNGLTLSALIILSCDKYSIPVNLLRTCIDILNNLLKEISLSEHTKFAHSTADDLLSDAIDLHKFDIISMYGVETVSLLRKQYIQLTYYRNNIIQLFIIPSLALRMIYYSDKIAKTEIIRCVSMLFGILQNELFIPVHKQDLDTYINKGLRTMISMELIDEINGCYRIKQKNMKTAKIIADISKETLIRYAVFFTIISSESIINYDNLEKTWSKILEHMDSSMLIPKAPEFRDLEIIKGLVSYLENHNMAKEINVDGLLKFDLDALEEIISLVVSLTSEELHGKIIQNLESLC